MITLEQIQLLEQKVESAVLKIAALTSENEELRHTLSLFEENKMRIEQGILNALNRLNEIENSVAKNHTTTAANKVQTPIITQTEKEFDATEEPQNPPKPDGQIDIF